ncbi:putative isochorismatase family protein [Colletotrichum spaethianum]|uniref:Isochorismatase family protein n=1 Tax=Colletotrichum spaethianum TaxID=700344 RepID=A0AA37PAS0_9PEZI|nr:putative isochorismatase family protein [Colletotrichum spaethianum]GKT48746.1 putative isochorismatase family protein [Colletotrichum spaethianum]
MASSNNGTALLVMDLIDNIVTRLPENKDFLPRVARAIAAAREKNILIIHVTIDFRRNYPEVPHTSQFWSRIVSTDAFVNAEGQPNKGLEFVPEAAPLPEEIVVSRKRISAFCSSDLEVILRSMGVRNLVLAGVATSGVVLSTVREAMDKDYGITVLEDLCMDRDEEVHRVLTTKVFPISGAVVKWEEWIAQL